MGKTNLSLQDSFLNQARQESLMVTVHLTNGSKLEGKVRGFDNFTLVLNNNGREHLIYKHAISTIIPLKAGAIANRNKISFPKMKELEILAEKYSKR
ncbi:RNA chaperone Hfq [candidate division NPL-UPA2 bacterium]|nr:RNA chaperone Hfq [candidate division NPL-UPA2 bacterium]